MSEHGVAIWGDRMLYLTAEPILRDNMWEAPAEDSEGRRYLVSYAREKGWQNRFRPTSVEQIDGRPIPEMQTPYGFARSVLERHGFRLSLDSQRRSCFVLTDRTTEIYLDTALPHAMVLDMGVITEDTRLTGKEIHLAELRIGRLEEYLLMDGLCFALDYRFHGHGGDRFAHDFRNRKALAGRFPGEDFSYQGDAKWQRR